MSDEDQTEQSDARGPPLMIERLAILKRADLVAKLRELECGRLIGGLTG